MATATRQRPRTAEAARPDGGPNSRSAAEFALGLLEAELPGIGKAASAREGADVPAGYFANREYSLSYF